MRVHVHKLCIIVLSAAFVSGAAAQGPEEAQLKAVKATDDRMVTFLAKFRDLVVQNCGAESKIGVLDATESRILANIHVGEKILPVRMTPRRFKSSEKFLQREPEGTQLVDLSVLDETRLRRIIELAHALPGASEAHLFKIEIKDLPEPVGRFAAIVELYGVKEHVRGAFDLTTGEALDVGLGIAPQTEAPARPVARRPRGGLREWLSDWDEVLKAWEGRIGAPLPALDISFTATGATAQLLIDGSVTSYRYDNQGLAKVETETALTALRCEAPFDPRQLKLDQLGKLADQAYSASAEIPYRSLVAVRIARAADCAAPEIRFVVRGPHATAEVAFTGDGNQIGLEIQ